MRWSIFLHLGIYYIYIYIYLRFYFRYLARDSLMQSARYDIARPWRRDSVGRSVHVLDTGGSDINGWSYDYAIFTSFIQKFWRVPWPGASNTGGAEKPKYFLALSVNVNPVNISRTGRDTVSPKIDYYKRIFSHYLDNGPKICWRHVFDLSGHMTSSIMSHHVTIRFVIAISYTCGSLEPSHCF